MSTDASEIAPPPVSEPIPTKDRLRGLRRCANVAWLSTTIAAILLWGEYLLGVLHPYAWTFLALAAAAIVSTLGVLILGLWRMLAGPRRWRALMMFAVGLMPAAQVVWLVAAGSAQYRRGHIAPTVPFVMFAMAGSSLGELEASLRYPLKPGSTHLVMFCNDKVKDPRSELDQMERFVANLERMTKRPLRDRIHWVRGPLLGQRHIAIGGLALGTDETPLLPVDRHELAHAVLYQSMPPGFAPPMLLSEGWAESQSKDPVDLAEIALRSRDTIRNLCKESDAKVAEVLRDWSDREGFTQFVARARSVGPSKFSYLRELTSPYWYHRDRGLNYSIGGAFADHVVRTYGADRFVDFYLSCRPGGVDRACQVVLDVPLDEAEARFWRDAERMTSRVPTPGG